jgi:uncharacterized protein (DUF1778 family)
MTVEECLDNVGQPPHLAAMSNTARTEKLDLRLTSDAKRRLYAAAEAQQRSVSEFVLQSALERADEALAGRRRFSLPPDDWKKFLAALDAPPRDLPRLKRLLTEPGFFDKQDKP